MMTPEQKLKHMILIRGAELYDKQMPVVVNAENIDQLYEDAEDWLGDCALYDGKGEVRGGDVETNLKAPYSRHYEAKEVAAKAPDGSWIGWTYWYGGGKHGEPEAMDWIDSAYALACVEEEKLVVVRTFKKAKS